MNTLALVEKIKETGQDFEWYPTTNEMLDVIKKDIARNHYDPETISMLDCGAGDGRALMHLTKGTRYAIEKSIPLLQAMDNKINVVGTEFEHQQLIDKKVSVVFSNPPYSQYEQWTNKIIKECNCTTVYLIIPQRWKNNESIKDLIKQREAKYRVIGEFDFLNAERQARATVDILRIDMGRESHHRKNEGPKVSPFDIWFDDAFNLDIGNKSISKFDWSKMSKKGKKKTLENEMVIGGDLVNTLERLYTAELSQIMKNYKALESIDGELFSEMDVNLEGLKGSLRLKIEGLKDLYWKELFDNMNKITSRLTIKSRDQMLKRLTAHTHVDFTASNAHAIMLWVIKNANGYFDEQLIDVVDRLTEKASVSLYKSNEKVYTNNDWMYNRQPENLERYKLEHRIVLHRVGGLHNSDSYWESSNYNGLRESAYNAISDLMTIADNLGFDTKDSITPQNCERWDSNKTRNITYYCHTTGKTKVLMAVKAFKNGNLHVKFDQKFIVKLNVEFGRLKGWLKAAQQASDELDISLADAEISFNSNLLLSGSNLLQLCVDTK